MCKTFTHSLLCPWWQLLENILKNVKWKQPSQKHLTGRLVHLSLAWSRQFNNYFFTSQEMWLTYSLQLISSNIKHWPNWNSYNQKDNIHTLFKLTYSLQLISSNSNTVQTLPRLNPLQPKRYCSHFVHTDLLPTAD